jgi:predicted nuclease of predicted toxin-antitoxin system
MSARQRKSKKPSGTRAERLLEESTFYTDECLGRHDVADALRAAGLKIEPWHRHFPPRTPDVEWLPYCGERGWVVLTKDKAIRRVEAEMAKVISSRVRMFTLTSGSMSGRQMASVFLGRRLAMARMLNANRYPFVATVSSSGVEIVRGGEPI